MKTATLLAWRSKSGVTRRGAKLADSRLNDHATMFGRANVARQHYGLSIGLLDEPLRFVRVVMLVQIIDEHIRPFAGVRDGNCAADTAVGSGDNCLLAEKLAAALVSLLTARRSGQASVDAGVQKVAFDVGS
jgi:hypothetical protein